ncbi:MAG: hypothetical protein ACLS4Z_05410 [Christensenellaceae bacterium]
MSQLQEILKYQEIDKRLYALEREIAGCEERKEYLKAKKFLETAADKLDSYDAKAAQLKNMAVELTKKYLKTEDTLKDFAHLDELVEGARTSRFIKERRFHRRPAEKIKAELSALTASINSTHDEYQKLKKQVIAMQKQYKDAYEKYNAVKASGRGQKGDRSRASAASTGISAEAMEKYKPNARRGYSPWWAR